MDFREHKGHRLLSCRYDFVIVPTVPLTSETGVEKYIFYQITNVHGNFVVKIVVTVVTF